jgi:hypothetical protein
VVDIGIFIVVLQFFAAMATVEGEDRVLLQGVIFLSLFLIVLLGALGVYSWLLGCWMIEIFRRMTAWPAQLNCCRVVGAEQQEMRWLNRQSGRVCNQLSCALVGYLFKLIR